MEHDECRKEAGHLRAREEADRIAANNGLL